MQLIENKKVPEDSGLQARPLFFNDFGFVHTYIASKHTRALDKVTERLVDEGSDKMKDLAGCLVSRDGEIASSFQFIFEVELEHNETTANEPVLVAECEGGEGGVFLYPQKSRATGGR